MCVCVCVRARCIRQVKLILKENIFLNFLLFQVTLSKAEVTENMRATSLQMPLRTLARSSRELKSHSLCFNFLMWGCGESSNKSNEEIHARKKNVRGGTHLL